MTTSPEGRTAIRTSRRFPTSAQPLTPPPKLRRRPSLIVASVLLVVIGALASAWAYTSLGNAQEVVAVRIDVARGQVITADSLQVVRVGVDPALKTVPASEAGSLVGKRAAVDLKAGQLVVPGVVATDVYPRIGKSAVGLSLSSAQMPSEPLSVGDKVRIVGTPGQQGEVDVAMIKVFDGEVVTVADTDASGLTAVTVEVAASLAPEVAARSASGRVAIVLESRVR
jgi:hypothetical protein